jgi:hypothetical protein
VSFDWPEREDPDVVEEPEREEAATLAMDATTITPAAVPDEQEPPPSRRRGLLIGGAVVVIGALAIAGYLIGDEPAPAPEPVATPRAVEAAAAAVDLPADWRQGEGELVPKELGLTDATTVQAGDGREVVLASAAPDAANPTLLPEPLRAAAGDAKPQVVRLGEDLEAYRYDAVAAGPRQLRVYAVPTDRGVEILACGEPSEVSEAFARACDEAAASLQLRGAAAAGVAPSADYARELSASLDRLEGARADGRRRLAEAGSRRTQVRAARALPNVYRDAGRAINRLEPPLGAREAHAGIVSALRDAHEAYKRLATAARRGNRAGFSRAADAADRRDEALQRAVEELGAAGYQLG